MVGTKRQKENCQGVIARTAAMIPCNSLFVSNKSEADSKLGDDFDAHGAGGATDALCG